MKRFLCMLLCLALLLSLWGCGRKPEILPEPSVTEAPTEPATTQPEETEPAPTEPEVTEPAPTEPAPTEPEVTEPAETIPEHSPLYLENVPVEDVIRWFNEVSLDTEFSDGGDATLVQKWDEPIAFMVHGDYTEEDWATLTRFTQWLNTLEGFPGISETQDSDEANLNIHFTDAQGLVNIMGQDFVGLDGAVTFWYDGDNAIYQEVICIRTDLAQEVRNSVIMEEIYNGLGPVQDTILREDSLIWQGYSIPQELTAVDELILKLLYHPAIARGMNALDCEEVIRTLYY
ncbi:MAG: DUF2927 domain-containing protein [Oscillospiraceae bacterium]|nr:DUF2927 domain-containing protein [Oscillospiraceae bacterium]